VYHLSPRSFIRSFIPVSLLRTQRNATQRNATALLYLPFSDLRQVKETVLNITKQQQQSSSLATAVIKMFFSFMTGAVAGVALLKYYENRNGDNGDDDDDDKAESLLRGTNRGLIAEQQNTNSSRTTMMKNATGYNESADTTSGITHVNFLSDIVSYSTVIPNRKIGKLEIGKFGNWIYLKSLCCLFCSHFFYFYLLWLPTYCTVLYCTLYYY
jgi:hypothetical protein